MKTYYLALFEDSILIEIISKKKLFENSILIKSFHCLWWGMKLQHWDLYIVCKTQQTFNLGFKLLLRIWNKATMVKKTTRTALVVREQELPSGKPLQLGAKILWIYRTYARFEICCEHIKF
jgi:hypothetical protein